MLKDINPNGNGLLDVPGMFVPAGNNLFFFANDGEHGMELWATDGTENGTRLVKDINPGSENGAHLDFLHLGALDSHVYFRASDGVHGYEIWRSDGTEENTKMVADIFSGDLSSNPEGFFPYNGKIFFAANDGIAGSELWATDGTEAGTEMIIDLYPGNNSYPKSFLLFNGKLYFIARGTGIGGEVWSSDGTAVGTMPLCDCYPGNSGQPNMFLSIAEGKLYWQSPYSGFFDGEPFVSDGTPGGTSLLKDIEPGENTSNARYFTGLNGMVYFIALNKLWRTDGTEAGTEEFNSTLSLTQNYGSDPKFANLNGYLYFSGNTGGGSNNELWRTDGITTELFDINPGFSGSYPSYFTVAGGALYFAAVVGNQLELFQTNGTQNGTFMVADINEGPNASSHPNGLFDWNGVLYFAATDETYGRELFRYSHVAVPLQATIMQNFEILCFGESTASLEVSVEGGFPPFAFEWSVPGIEGSNPVNLPAGTYSVTISDAGGDTLSQVYEIIQPDQLILTLDSSPAISNQSNGTANVIISGGVTPYVIEWSNGGTVDSIENLPPGEYSVTVIDANFCLQTATITVDHETSTFEAAESQFKIYPNPSQDFLFIEINDKKLGKASLKIYNSWGSVIKTILLTNETLRLDRNGLPSGVYFYSIENEGFEIATGKFVFN